MLGRHAGADDVDAVEGRLLSDLLDPSPPGERAVADIDIEVLGHFPAVEHHADRQAKLGGVVQAGSPEIALAQNRNGANSVSRKN
jgi:hypothetical protein